MLASSGQHVLSLASWQLAKEMGTESVALGSSLGMTRLVATIFDNSKYACASWVGQNPTCPIAAWPVNATGRGKFTMATELPNSISCAARPLVHFHERNFPIDVIKIDTVPTAITNCKEQSLFKIGRAHV